ERCLGFRKCTQRVSVVERLTELCLVWQLDSQKSISHLGHLFFRTISTLQRQNTENLKHIFPKKEYQGLSPNFHIHVSVSELYIPTMGLPFLLEEICRPLLGLYKSKRVCSVGIYNSLTDT
ncbi:MAG: hypothetical protein ACK55Z_03465, partial [bacterium]